MLYKLWKAVCCSLSTLSRISLSGSDGCVCAAAKFLFFSFLAVLSRWPRDQTGTLGPRLKGNYSTLPSKYNLLFNLASTSTGNHSMYFRSIRRKKLQALSLFVTAPNTMKKLWISHSCRGYAKFKGRALFPSSAPCQIYSIHKHNNTQQAKWVYTGCPKLNVLVVSSCYLITSWQILMKICTHIAVIGTNFPFQWSCRFLSIVKRNFFREAKNS